MSDTYRLYCTHCTFGSSALEVSSTDNASKVLGYSVRATSLPANERGRLRQVFRAIERLLSYNLPSDATPLDKETCDASSSPRRLLFMPDLQGFQVTGQLCYRSQDTAGRPGSYFADMIVSPIDARQLDNAWSPLDCLRLWRPSSDSSNRGAGWCESEDQIGEGLGGDGGVPLPAINSPSDLLEGCNGAVVTDQAFLAFLTNDSANTDKAELSAVIPARWAEIPAAQRQELFVQLLQATINLLDRRHGAVTIAVEPSLAALLFYGICRVLPEKLIRLSDRHAGLSFSTYESAPERSMTNLVATTFLHESNSADLPPEIYHRGFACNTFTEGFKYGQQIAPGVFAHKIIGLLTAGENTPFSAIDELIRMIDFMPGASILGQTLDILVQADEEVRNYLSGSTNSHQNLPAHAAQLSPEATHIRSRCLLTAIERFSQQGHTSWPDDLLETTIAWSGDALVQKWPASQPIQTALRSNLPTGKEGKDRLERLLAINDGKPQIPDALLLECATEVSVALGRIPSCIRTYLAGTGKDPAKWLRGLLKDIAQPSRETLIEHTATGLFEDALLQAVSPRNMVSGETLTNLLSRLLDFEKFAFDQKWGILLNHHGLCGALDSSNKKFQAALNSLFDSLSESTPHCLTTRSAEENAGLLKNWAAFTQNSDANQQLITARYDLHQALLPLLAEAAEQNNRRLPSFGNKRPEEKITAAAEKLDYLAGCSGRGTKRETKLEILEEALGEQNQQPENKQLVTSWVTSYLNEISAAKTPPALKGKNEKTAVTSKTSRWPEIVPATKGIAVVALFLLACTTAFYAFRFIKLDLIQGTNPATTEITASSSAGTTNPKNQQPTDPSETSHNQQTDKPAVATMAGQQQLTTDQQPKPKISTPSEEEIGLKLVWKGERLFASWNSAKLHDRKYSLVITTPGTKPSEETEPKSPLEIPLKGYGPYTAELKLQGSTTPYKTDKTFSPPPSLTIQTIRLAATGGKTPHLVFGVNPTVNNHSPDIPGSSIHCQLLTDDNVKPIDIGPCSHMKEDERSFSLPTDLSTEPHELQTAHFQLFTKTPLGRGHVSKSKKLDISQLKSFGEEWMDQQYDRLTVLGVRGVLPLKENEHSVSIPLPPTIEDKDLAFSLLGPQRDNSQETIVTEHAEDSPGHYTSSLIIGKSEGEGTEEGKGTPKDCLAIFSLDRKDSWSPRGVLELPETLSEARRNLVRSSKVKLDVAGKSYYFQLVTPELAPPLKLPLWWSTGPRCPARRVLSKGGVIPDINLDTSFWIPAEELPVDTAAPEGHEPSENTAIKAVLTASEKHDQLKLTLRLNNEDYANAELSTEQEADVQVISVTPFEWTQLPDRKATSNKVIQMVERVDLMKDAHAISVEREKKDSRTWSQHLSREYRDRGKTQKQCEDDMAYLRLAINEKRESLKAYFQGNTNPKLSKLLRDSLWHVPSSKLFFSATDIHELAQWKIARLQNENDKFDVNISVKALERIKNTVEDAWDLKSQQKCNIFARELARSEININRYQSRSHVAGDPQTHNDSVEHAVVWFVCDTSNPKWEAEASKVDRKGYVKFEEVKRR